MRSKRADTVFNGVTRRGKFYRAWVKHRGAYIQLGTYAVATNAALAADFGRWLLWGHPSTWYNVGRRRPNKPPNFAPVVRLPFARQAIIDEVIGHVPPLLFANNLTAYNDAAAEWAQREDGQNSLVTTVAPAGHPT